MSLQPNRPGALVRLAALTTVVLCTTGCAKIVSDIAMLPVKVAEHVAVETARLPFKAAELGTRSLVDATIGNVGRALAGK